MGTDYRALWAQKQAEYSGDLARAQQLYALYGEWIDRYRGGIPGGWMAVIVMWESNGVATLTGDASLGEYGLCQIAAYVPPLFGLPADARMDPETNICLACLEYDMEAILFSIDVPQVALGTADAWKLARLAFAVGRGGSRALAAAAASSGGLIPGDVYGSIRDWANKTGAMALGGQSADQVWFRIVSIDLQWQMGEAVGGGFVGGPQIPPDPPAGPIVIPPNIAPYFTTPGSNIVLVGAALLLAALFWRNR